MGLSANANAGRLARIGPKPWCPHHGRIDAMNASIRKSVLKSQAGILMVVLLGKKKEHKAMRRRVLDIDFVPGMTQYAIMGL